MHAYSYEYIRPSSLRRLLFSGGNTVPIKLHGNLSTCTYGTIFLLFSGARLRLPTIKVANINCNIKTHARTYPYMGRMLATINPVHAGGGRSGCKISPKDNQVVVVCSGNSFRCRWSNNIRTTWETRAPAPLPQACAPSVQSISLSILYT